jgi:hypothetical protein
MVRKAERITRNARKAAERWRSYWQTNINQYHEMHDFVLGRQWTDDESSMLKTYKKIPLQFNKLGTMVNSLLGEQQQNTPQLQVVPMDNCNEEVAQIREVIVKDLTLGTEAKNCYQVAASQSFIGGFGAFLWDTEYRHNKSFDLDIVPRYFKDATRCYWDVSAERLNKTDGQHCGYLMRMSRSKFRDVYGKNIEDKIYPEGKGNAEITASREEIAAVTETSGAGFNWSDEDSITIQHHYVRKKKADMLYKMSNGRILNQEELNELIESSVKRNEQIEQERQEQEMMQLMQAQQQQSGMGMEQQPQEMNMGQDSMQPQQPPPEPQAPQQPEQLPPTEQDGTMTLWDDDDMVRIEDKRDSDKYVIKHYVLAGDYILDEGDFPSEQLPLVFVDQNSYYDKNGKQICRPFLIDAKDAQKYLNYLGTQSAYVLKVSRYDQWIGSKQNVRSLDTQQVWRDPLSIQGILTFDESPTNVTPQQITPPELSQSLLTQYQRAIEDLYTSTGLYPTRMGQQGNEVSGVAIDARTRQGSYSTYSAFNSINRAIAVGGEIVNEMIPRVYDAERVLALQMPDEGMQNITVNRQADEYGEHIENDIRKGTFQVRLMPGPSYEGQKEQALTSLQQVIQASPETFQLIADLYAENLPLMNTIELKNRLKTLVPPQILEAGKTGKSMQQQQPQPPSPEQQAMQMEAQFKQATLQLKQQEIQIKQQELQLKSQEIQAEIALEYQKLQTEQLEVAGKLEEQKLRYLAETERTQSDAAISHADNITKILTHKLPDNL